MAVLLLILEASDEVQERDAEVQEVFDALVRDIAELPEGESQEARWLLAHLLEYFRREDKCNWWNSSACTSWSMMH